MCGVDVYRRIEMLIEELTDRNLIEKCTLDFVNIKETSERVEFVEKLIYKFALAPCFSDLVKKCDDSSWMNRVLGNEFFSLNNIDYFRAIEYYNKSLCYSEPDSECLSLGYGNRSAVLFQLKLYKECLQNIVLAENHKCSQELLSKLEKRKAACIEKLSSPQTSSEINFSLAYGSHSVAHFASDCLEVTSNESSGRFVYTTKDLKPGDLVIEEDPFCTVLVPKAKYTRCAECNEENAFTLLPCNYCVDAMFCNEKCRTEAFQGCHKYECPVLGYLHSSFNKIQLISLRVTLTALDLFDNVEDLKSFCANLNGEDHAFNISYNEHPKKEIYKAIHGLVTNESKRSIPDLFQRTFIAALFKIILSRSTVLKNVLKTNDHENFFVDLLYRHVQTSSCNMHSVDLIEQKDGADISFASGAYAGCSLINHSCSPNTVRIYKGTKCLLFVLRPIKAGDPLFDNYGYHYATLPKAERQKHLSSQYHFECRCEACEKNFGIWYDLPRNGGPPHIVSEEDSKNLWKCNKDHAELILKRYCSFLDRYGSYYPCNEISLAEEAVKMCLNIIVDAVPLKQKLMHMNRTNIIEI